MIKKWILFFCCIMAVALQTHAQQDSTDVNDTLIAPPVEAFTEDETGNDETQITPLPDATPRYLDGKTVEGISSGKEFGYMSYIDSALRNRKTELAENRERELPKENTSFDWVKPVLWILAVAGLLFIVWRLWAGKGFVFNPTYKKPGEASPETEDPLLVAGAAALAADAISKKEYRLAVRYLFVDTLLRLGDTGKLQILARKTNQEYLKEIQVPTLANDLATIMLQFEYVWYGGFVPSEKQFQTILSTFKKFETRWL